MGSINERRQYLTFVPSMEQASEHTVEEEENIRRKIKSAQIRLQELQEGGGGEGGQGEGEGDGAEEGVGGRGGDQLESSQGDGIRFKSNCTAGSSDGGNGKIKRSRGGGMPEIELSRRGAAAPLPEIEQGGALAASAVLDPEIEEGEITRPPLTASVALAIGARWESNAR